MRNSKALICRALGATTTTFQTMDRIISFSSLTTRQTRRLFFFFSGFAVLLASSSSTWLGSNNIEKKLPDAFNNGRCRFGVVGHTRNRGVDEKTLQPFHDNGS
jgi:hypothetical protein